ncbi:putative ABC transport system permease protein [Gracilibacillus ureilyticus]|uniref:Putative ABC transport system permease protein n=1 Tax=Gracilibacillus ureilyticus TaxID=531814 RepID=A0A1H9UTW1_9BACI|nr:ABC transporter permease [Gracilibacillus ureilyticus]SES12852.1 putative ABC transport system permease protein [Gracilibacillus ureilyticus]
MNIINKLTIRHLKQNRKRTLVTIIGIIISVAMITAVTTLGVSFLDLMKRQSIADNGEWHALYRAVSEEDIDIISSDHSVDEISLISKLGYAKLEGAHNPNKPYLFIQQINDNGLAQFPITLKGGRLPNSPNEIIISNELWRDTEVVIEIGDQITMDIGQRYDADTKVQLGQSDELQVLEGQIIEEWKKEETRTFTVVGIIEQSNWDISWSPGYTAISYLDMERLSAAGSVNAHVTFKDVNFSLFKNAENIMEQLNREEVTYNNELLRYYGLTKNMDLAITLFSLFGIIILVIMIGSISLIYNAFAISVSERSRHLGMLSSIGATKKQKRNSVFFEGAVVGSISIPLGIIAGVCGIALTFWFINSVIIIEESLGVSENLYVVLTPWSIITSVIISAVTIFISTYKPAIIASRISAIDAIRQSNDVKLSGKSVKTSKLTRKLFGIEAEIGLKNLKRNKKRYRATLFSLVISIVLFISISYFTDNLEKSFEMSMENINFDFKLGGNSNNLTDVDLDPFTKLETVTEYSMVDFLQVSTWVDEDKINERLKQDPYYNEALKDGKYPYYVNFYGYDHKSFSAYAKKIGADPEEFMDPSNPKAIIIDEITYRDPETGRFIHANSIHQELGDELSLFATDYETDKELPLGTIETGALTDQIPMGMYTAHTGGVDVVVPEQIFNELAESAEHLVEETLFLNSSDPDKTVEEINELKTSGISYYNVVQQKEDEQRLLLFMAVFVYGFIVLISAISIANIFNTISTSVALRKREFAMLKSVGMTPKSFDQMIYYESIFYGIKALLYGLPLSVIIIVLMYNAFLSTFEYGFMLPWMSILFVIISIFVIVGATMIYSIKKIKKENIMDGLKQESI